MHYTAVVDVYQVDDPKKENVIYRGGNITTERTTDRSRIKTEVIRIVIRAKTLSALRTKLVQHIELMIDDE